MLPSGILSWRKAKAGTEAEAMQEHCLTGLFSLILLPYTTQDHLPRAGTAHHGLSLPMPINIQKNVSQTSPWANLLEIVPKLRSPLSR